MPGKRKRDEESDEEQEGAPEVHIHGSTVFVSNLPYTATSTDLKTLFSDVAPIKNAFVVLEKDTKISKGVGYVTFAMREDAAQCVEKGAIEMNGRNLRVTWAGAKPKPGETAPVKHPKIPKKIKAETTSKSHDTNAIRTVALSGLPDGIDAKVVWKKVRKQEGVESLEYPVKDSGDSEDKSKAHVLFATPSQALHAIERLNAHTFKGAVLSATLKKRLEKKPNRSSRLIVRNLPWDTTESDLRKLFLPHGAIYSVEIPTSPTPSDKPGRAPRAKGFAFVWMLSKADAEKAIDAANGSKIKDRPIAVDWALSKEKWLNVKEKLEEQEEGDEQSESDTGGSHESDQDDGLGVHSDEDVSMHSRSDDEVSEAPTRPELPPPEAGTTLFIRNVPWEATEDDLRQLFRSFGPLRYVRIVMDHESNRSKGTAFACYWQKEDADKVVAISETLSKETDPSTTTKNPFSTPSLLAPDPSSSLARSLVLHGRTLGVVRAVTRDTALKLKDAGVKAREKADKRNLYLMREGVIFPNSPAASTIPAAELEKRVNSYNQRRAILRSNPSLYVSKTRLSIRQLPIFVSEKVLKRLALHAIDEFDKEVDGGTREPLAEDEIDDDGRKAILDPLTGEEVELPSSSKAEKRKLKVARRIKQTKIVRLADRIDPLTGKGRSKGYGFLELERHDDALRVLRWANNNPDVGSLLKIWWHEEIKGVLDVLRKKQSRSEEEESRFKRLKDVLEGEGDQKMSKRTLIVEFSIENVLIMKKRQSRDSQSKHSKPHSDDESTKTDKTRRASHLAVEKPKRRPKSQAHEEGRPSKKVKKDDGKPSALAARIGKPAKAINPIGSIIGRKRRLRKAKG